MKDQLGRPMRDLRISVTDRCNFRCVYCMPKEIFGPDFAFLPAEELLTFDEIERVARAFAAFGVHKVRLTGGEPLLRPKLDQLIARLARVPGIDDLTMTTNGSALAEQAGKLAAAGLDRVSVSLDAIDDGIFRTMNDVDFPVDRVLRGIEAADAAGLHPIKINMVVKRGVNDGQVLPMAQAFRGTGHILRFIEYMDVGMTNGWRMAEVLPSREIVERIDSVYPLDPVEPNYYGEVANRYRYRDGAGEIGLISSVTQPFCGDCTRVRLSADGRVYTCLFASQGEDVRHLLRNGADDNDLLTALEDLWRRRRDRYSEERSTETLDGKKVEMHFIGG
ncbi:MAG: GTP 3',8-cyclase MoaA [Anaerolineales bacterium]